MSRYDLILLSGMQVVAREALAKIFGNGISSFPFFLRFKFQRLRCLCGRFDMGELISLIVFKDALSMLCFHKDALFLRILNICLENVLIF